MATSAISDQNVLTAEEFQSPIQQPMAVFLSIDDVALVGELHREQWIFSQNGLRFTVDVKTIVKFEKKKETGETRLIIEAGAAQPAFWKLLYQVQIHVGWDEKNLVSVDQFNADFLPGSKPLTVDVVDEDVRIVLLQMRTINRMYWPLPDFKDGDVTLLFDQEPPLRTWAALLAGASPYFAERLASAPGCDGLNMGSFPRKDIEQMLYQLYPTNWPLYLSFGCASRAAVGYHVPLLIHRLSKHLVKFQDMPVLEKWKYAMAKGLAVAVQIMVYEDVKVGAWDRRIAAGFNPEAFFSPAVYQKAICPMILAARGVIEPPVKLVDPWKQPDYFSPSPYKISLTFLKTKFYVNQGVLATHGTRLARDSDGLAMIFSPDMQFYCAKEDLLPGKVLIAVLDSLHPGGPLVPDIYLKTALILCHDHGWTRAKENLEQRLLTEPCTTSQHFFEQVRFAETFGLENMLRALALRVETDYSELCKSLLEKKAGITEKTRHLLTQRLEDGWSKEHIGQKAWAVGMRKPTSQRDRLVGKERPEEPDVAQQQPVTPVAV